MEKHFCDRCGEQTTPNAAVSESVLLDGWKGEWFTQNVARLEHARDLALHIRLRGQVLIDGWEDPPDLCDGCIVDVLLGAADALMKQRKERIEEQARKREAEAAAADNAGGDL